MGPFLYEFPPYKWRNSKIGPSFARHGTLYVLRPFDSVCVVWVIKKKIFPPTGISTVAFPVQISRFNVVCEICTGNATVEIPVEKTQQQQRRTNRSRESEQTKWFQGQCP